MMKCVISRFLRIIQTGLTSIALISVFILPLNAADDRESVIPPVIGKIQIDGILNDPTWEENASTIHLTQVEPNPGDPPTEATRVWLAAEL